ncbi:MAG: hypothetical protein VX701_02130 [Chloroflexota bacterium]|nr:hypothetical protein [Chloroflexota bacterium]
MKLAQSMAAFGLVLIMSGCGGNESSQSPKSVELTATVNIEPSVAIKAEICKKRVEGLPGYNMQLFVRNMNDFTWNDTTFIGQDFTNQKYKNYVDVWPPESVQKAEPLVRPQDFKTNNYGQPLTTFSLLTTLSVDVEEPFSDVWIGEVKSCE